LIYGKGKCNVSYDKAKKSLGGKKRGEWELGGVRKTKKVEQTGVAHHKKTPG